MSSREGDVSLWYFPDPATVPCLGRYSWHLLCKLLDAQRSLDDSNTVYHGILVSYPECVASHS